MNKLYKWTMVDSKDGSRLYLLDALIISALTLICGGIARDLFIGVMIGMLNAAVFNVFMGNYSWEYYE